MEKRDTIHALAFGEILWDIIDNEPHIGGAPFNLAAHMAALGGEVSIASAVGKDRLGSAALEEVKHLGIDNSFINIHPQLATGTVPVSLDAQGKPEYEIVENVAWDAITLSDAALEAISKRNWDLFVFGTLAQRSKENRQVLRELVDHSNAGERFFDVNLRLSYYSAKILHDSLMLTTILKLNDEEVPIVSDALFSRTMREEEFCKAIFDTFPVRMICITKGKDGSTLFDGKMRYDEPIVDIPVVDTVGAGDSFSAAFLTAYLKGLTKAKALRFASRLSSFVAGSSGAVPAYTGWILDDITAMKDSPDRRE
ncbi:carbohydrate kinase family protein [Sediminispirochaeta smaragdinae]|uniref:PfkB domain protein n=1 Tax=Sediminispirochaeta smaragdinae (strain DSM 11293 / JCM 15392 / SEBR 4228) TaxID=573413 RepID=E1R5V6_SEDSS|nr:carbohydrate kinase [Sediminispirochaeta smaragdinae]ADK80721.1 PfkB domain protein [Sediminispirochaeta smaragdinae DSM 11293]